MELTPKQQRAVSLANSIINTALTIAESAKHIPKHKLPRIAKAARKRRALAFFRMYFAFEVGRAQACTIMSQPIPKYPAGTTARPSWEWAIIGDNGPEVIELSAFDRKLFIPRVPLPNIEPLNYDQSIGAAAL